MSPPSAPVAWGAPLDAHAPMSVRFDGPARRAIERAMIEAESRQHATLDTGHILLGLLAPADAAAVAVLTHLGVSADSVRESTVRLLDAEFAAGTLAMEISPATDDLLLRAYQNSLARESASVSDVDILVACAMDVATTAGMALQDTGVTVERLEAVTPLPAPVAAAPAALARRESGEPPASAPVSASTTPLLGDDGGPARRVVLPGSLMFGGVPALPGTVRSGIGYDSHRFEPGGPLLLGGVSIPADVHLVGHSDGDAVAHAITDAVLGAAAAGDIGEMFSDEDDANRGRDSIEMLRAAVERVRRRGFAVQQVDVTVVAERPRIAPHRPAISARLAEALGVSLGSVSVKGKTNEGMGWVGRGEGLACIAVATIVVASDA